MNSNLDFSVINEGDTQNKAFIMIHGWKGNKDSFKSIPKILDIPNCRWYAPEAPFLVNKGENQKTWTYEKSPGVWEIEKPKAMLLDFIENEVFTEFDPLDTYIMGFSQGAAICYRLVLSLEYTLGGVFPIGGFIRSYPNQKDNEIKLNISFSQKDTPILIGHGRDDDVIPVEASKLAYKLLKKKCSNVDLYIYKGRQKISIEYLKKVKQLVMDKEVINI